MQQIVNKLSQFSIIGLGENSHYVNYPTKYRIELFKLLSQQSNFNTIFLETDIFYASIINAYIHSIIDSDPFILVQNIFYMWHSSNIVNFIKWLRNYNKYADQSRKIFFIGFDSQNPFFFRKNKYISKSLIKDTLKYYQKIFNISSDTFKKLYSFYTTGYEKKYGDTILYDRSRELLSYQIFQLHYQKILPKNSKVCILAHQAHLSKIKSKSFPHGPFGYYISKHFKKNYISIGMDILTGKLACKKILKGININYGIKLIKFNNVQLIDNNYHYSNECDSSLSQYTINPLKYHDAVLVFTNDTPYTSNNSHFKSHILSKLQKFIKNKKFDLKLFYKKYKVDIPNKLILVLLS
jgi:hypothetical protein